MDKIIISVLMDIMLSKCNYSINNLKEELNKLGITESSNESNEEKYLTEIFEKIHNLNPENSIFLKLINYFLTNPDIKKKVDEGKYGYDKHNILWKDRIHHLICNLRSQNYKIEEGVVKNNYDVKDTFLKQEIFDTEPRYSTLCNEINICYVNGAFNGCLVLCRKMLENIIIDLFRRRKIDNEIRDPKSNMYFSIDTLIKNLITYNGKNPDTFHLSRNVTDYLSKLSKIRERGGIGAHNMDIVFDEKDLNKYYDETTKTLEELFKKCYPVNIEK